MAYFVPLFPAAGCPLMAISGHSATPRIMSALPPKADLLGRHEKGLLLTLSGPLMAYGVSA